MERAVGPEYDGVFLGLGVAEIADAPERAGQLLAIDAVGFGDAHGAAQIFVGDGIHHGDKSGRRAVGLRAQAAGAQRLVSDAPRVACVDANLHVVADRRGLPLPGQGATGHERRREKADQSRRERVVTLGGRRGVTGRGVSREAHIREGHGAVQQRLVCLEAPAQKIGNPCEDQRSHRRRSHHRPGNFEVQAVRADQQQAYEQRVHGVVPDERREDAPAQQDHSGHDADDAHLDPADVAGLLRVGAMQKAPGKGREDHGDPAGARQLFQKGNGEQPEQKLLAGRSEQADGHAGDPRKGGVHRVGVVQVLRRPDAEAAPVHVEGHDEANVRRGHAQADEGGIEKLPGAQAAQGQGLRQAQAARLRDAVERLGGGENQGHGER